MDKFFNVPVQILSDINLKTAEKALLVTLCRYADNSGFVIAPSQKIMAMYCSMTEYWTRETLKELEKRGYVKLITDMPRSRRYQIMCWPEAD